MARTEQTKQQMWDSVETEAQDRTVLSLEQLVMLAEEGKNIAEYLDDKTLEEIGADVVEVYNRDKGTQEEWEKRTDVSMKLAMQVAEKKTYPTEHAANVKFPLLTIGAIQFAARAGPSIVRTPEPVKGRVNGQFTQDKALKARRKGQHLSFQLLEQIPGWVEDMDRLLHSLPIVGGEFKKTWHDGRTIRSEWVPSKNLVFDYYAKSVETCRVVTELIQGVHPQTIKERQNTGRYLDVELGPAGVAETDEVQDKIQGKEPPAARGDDGPYELLEQHRWWDLDDDGYEEPYVVTVERESKKVLCLYARFDSKSVAQAARGVVIEPIQYYTQYCFFPDPTGGVRGIGWGHLLTPINEVVNTAVNQLIDAGSDQNTKSGFITKSLAAKLNGGKTGRITLAQNEYQVVDSFGDDIAKGIWDKPRAEPSPVLFQLLGLMVEWGQRLTSVTETMSGENPPTNQPATTTLALLEQGLKVFGGVYQRIFRAFDSELKKIARLNARYLDEEEYFRILDVDPLEVPANAEMANQAAQQMAQAMGVPPEAMEQAMPQLLGVARQMMAQGKVFRTDYEDDGTDVTPSADPTVKTEQQVLARARMLLEGLQQGLPLNPQRASELYLDAGQFSKDERKDLILPPQPPPPDPKLVIEQMRQEFQQMMEQMRLGVQAKAASDKEETARIKLAANKDTEEKRLQLDAARIGMEGEKAQAAVVTSDLDRMAGLEQARMKKQERVLGGRDGQ